jgi:hypothetical protein
MQVSPAPQQWLQPRSVSPGAQSEAQVPPEQTSPHPQGGSQVLGTQVPLSQNSSVPQAPVVQVPPQPSGPPHRVHWGTHSQAYPPDPLRSQNSLVPSHGPRQNPPHPFGSPHALPAQSGSQTHEAYLEP